MTRRNGCSTKRSTRTRGTGRSSTTSPASRLSRASTTPPSTISRPRSPLSRNSPNWRRPTRTSSPSGTIPGSPRRPELGEPVQIDQERAELPETLRAEFLLPTALDLGDGLTDDADGGGAARREGDALGAEVVGVRSPLEVAETLELAQEMVQGLLADPEPRR